jgi:hypothetical protein
MTAEAAAAAAQAAAALPSQRLLPLDHDALPIIVLVVAIARGSREAWL